MALVFRLGFCALVVVSFPLVYVGTLGMYLAELCLARAEGCALAPDGPAGQGDG